MNICYVSSDLYFPLLITSINSVLVHHVDVEINFIIVSDNISESNLFILKTLIKKYKKQLEIIEKHKLVEQIINYSSVQTHHGSNNIFISLLLGKINVEKILYLEPDTIVTDCLLELYNIDMKNYYFGGLYMKFPKSCSIYKPEKKWYLNGGVLLINNKLMSENNEISNIKQYLNKIDEASAESVIYDIYNDKMFPISPRYNMIPQFYYNNQIIISLREIYEYDDLNISKDKPVVIHYASSYLGRPWENKCTHPKKKIFNYYILPSYDIPLWKSNNSMIYLIKKFYNLKIKKWCRLYED